MHGKPLRTKQSQNTLYYLYAYGRNPGGQCGAGIAPVPIRVQLPNPTGEHRLKIEYSSALDTYQLFVDNVFYRNQPATDLQDCWPTGVLRSGAFNEVVDVGTQSGGRVADKQDFRDVRYKTGVWNLLARPLGDECDFEQRATQECLTSTVDSNNYYMWDTRFP